MKLRYALFVFSMLPFAGRAEWKAGAAKVPITPRGPLFMAGFGNRTRPADGASQELWAKALALEGPGGVRAVVVTTDMLGFPASLSAAVSDRVRQKYGIPRERLLFNSSHTHCGPVVEDMHAAPTWPMTAKDREAMAAYTAELREKIVAVVGEAIGSLAPARLEYGKTVASFGVHRRMPGGRLWGPNYAGPADHDVPVLRVLARDGGLRAVAFGYACHNSSLGIYQFHGDYAGSAQKWLEDRHPGAVALFVMGCGGDVKPYPNGSVELTESYGAVLGASVDERMKRPLQPLNGELAAFFKTVPLRFAAPPSRAELAERARTGTGSSKRFADTMLSIIDRDGRLPESYPWPVQAWRIGDELTLLAMGGEVTSEYALRLKKELGPDNLWVAGYSNDVFAYIPSLRILEEGGYEAASSMEFYLQPASWAPSVEDTVLGAAREAVAHVRSSQTAK